MQSKLWNASATINILFLGNTVVTRSSSLLFFLALLIVQILVSEELLDSGYITSATAYSIHIALAFIESYTSLSDSATAYSLHIALALYVDIWNMWFYVSENISVWVTVMSESGVASRLFMDKLFYALGTPHYPPHVI